MCVLTSACVVFATGAANVAAIVKDTDKTNRNNGSVLSRSIFHSFDMFRSFEMTESEKMFFFSLIKYSRLYEICKHEKFL